MGNEISQRELVIFPLLYITYAEIKKYLSTRVDSRDRHGWVMPCPSARTKNILSWTKFKLSRTKDLSRVKKSIFCLQKSSKIKLPDWKSLENLSSIRNIHIQWLLKVKNGLFNPGQNFCPGQFQYCPGQKMFCPSRWTRH